jgi:hypothetical protein
MKQSEVLDMITKIQLAHQAMESACKRLDELKEENKNLKEALAKQEQRSDSEQLGEPVVFKIYKPTPPRHAIPNVRDAELPWVYDQDPSSGNVASMWVTPVKNTPQQRTWVGLTPLNIEDEYVRNYLWERALIAIDDPCCRSHPHENMNEYCQRRTELARHQAKLKEKNNG